MKRIVSNARVNLRLIYHYFGSKQKLYLACLERVFVELRQAERALELHALPPVDAMRKLIDFTFDHLSRRPEFLGMVRSENQLGAQGFLSRSKLVRALTTPLLVILEDLIERGQRDGLFRGDVDAVQFFITLQALATVHVSNRRTLSAILGMDLADPGWLKERRRHGHEVLFSYLMTPAARAQR